MRIRAIRAALLGIILLSCPALSLVAQGASTPAVVAQEASEQKAREDMEKFGYQWTLAVAQGTQNSAGAKRAKARYDTAARQLGFDPDDAIQPRITFLISPQIGEAASRLAEEVRKGKENGSEAKRLRVRIARLGTIAAVSPAEDLKSAFRYRLYISALSWAKEKYQPRPDAALLQKYETQMRRLALGAKTSIAVIKREATQSQLSDPGSKTASRIAELIVEGKGDSAEAGVLRAQLFAAARRLDYDVAPMLAENLRYRLDERLQILAREFIVERNTREPDIKKLETARTKLLRLSAARGVSLDKRLRIAEDEWLGSAPYTYASHIVRENAKDAPDEKLIAFWQAKLKSTVARWQTMPQLAYKHGTTAEQLVAEAEFNLYTYYNYGRDLSARRSLSHAASMLAAEKALLEPDVTNIARYEAEIEKMQARISPLGREKLKPRIFFPARLFDIRLLFIEELRKDAPDAKRVAQIEAIFIERQGEDWYVKARKTGEYTRLPPITDAQEYGRWRVERIKARIAGEKIEARIKAPSTPLSSIQVADLEAARAALAAREKELMVRMGDPLIRVSAPRDAIRVVAILPGGEIKNLQFDEESSEWQARFDVPTHSEETQYTMQLVTVLKNGNRLYQTFSYRVDLTAPQAGVLRATAVNSVLDLEITTEKNVARVDAILPWSARISLKRSAKENRFGAKVPVPFAYAEKTIPVTLVLTDRAHNRTMIETEIKPQVPSN